MKHKRSLKPAWPASGRQLAVAGVVLLFAVGGLASLRFSRAATYSIDSEAEAGALSGAASIISGNSVSSGSSDNKSVKFGGGDSTPAGPLLYVSTNGSDSNDGSSARPFKTIVKGFNAASAGTTIILMPGNYTGDVHPSKGGTAAGYITLMSQTKYAATIIGGFAIDKSYIRIQGLEITGANVDFAMDVTASNVQVIGNKIHGISQKASSNDNGGSGMEFYTDNYGPLTNIVADGNMVYDIGLGPGQDELTQGIYLSVKCTGCRVTNNIVFDVTDFGIHSYHSPDGWIVANNTVFDNGRGILTGPNYTLINNISYNNKSSNYDLRGSGTKVSNNLAGGTGAGSGVGITSGDPLFVNLKTDGTGDLHLKPGSPALDKGTSLSAPVVDINGSARPQGSGHDIGAYEQ